MHNIGGLIAVRAASSAFSITAGAGTDNTTKTGIAIDRLDPASASLARSAVFAVLTDATLASGATLQVAGTVYDSADGTNFAVYNSTSFAAMTVSTGPSGGGARVAQAELDVDLSSARRYVRFDHVPNLSAAGTDTAITCAVAVFGGFGRLPA